MPPNRERQDLLVSSNRCPILGDGLGQRLKNDTTAIRQGRVHYVTLRLWHQARCRGTAGASDLRTKIYCTLQGVLSWVKRIFEDGNRRRR